MSINICLRSWKLRTLSINNQCIKTRSSFNRIPDILADNMSRIKNPTIRMVSKRPFGQDFLTIGKTNDSRFCIRPDSQNSMNMETSSKSHCTISIMKSNDMLSYQFVSFQMYQSTYNNCNLFVELYSKHHSGNDGRGTSSYLVACPIQLQVQDNLLY